MLNVIDGDITKSVEVDAIVTMINSSGLWFGAVDGAIMKVAGNEYHSQTVQARPLHDGQVVIATGEKSDHTGSFDDVVFVVDDLRQPLANLLRNALGAIKKQGYTSVAMPMFRTGVMLGVVEPDVIAVIDQIEQAFAGFDHENIDITFVVYREPETCRLLTASFA